MAAVANFSKLGTNCKFGKLAFSLPTNVCNSFVVRTFHPTRKPSYRRRRRNACTRPGLSAQQHFVVSLSNSKRRSTSRGLGTCPTDGTPSIHRGCVLSNRSCYVTVLRDKLAVDVVPRNVFATYPVGVAVRFSGQSKLSSIPCRRVRRAVAYRLETNPRANVRRTRL